MATQYIEDPDTKQQIPFEWDKPTPPTAQDIGTLFKAVKLGERGNSSPPAESPGILSRIGSDIYKRGANIANTLSNKSWGDIPKAQTILQVAGDVAGIAGDIGGEAIKSIANYAVPEEARKVLRPVGRAILDTPIGQAGIRALKTGTDAYGEFKKSYPDMAKDIESIVNIASFLPMAKAGKSAYSLAKEVGSSGLDAIKPLAQEGINVGKDVLNKISKITPEVIEQKTKQVIDTGITRGIRPSVSGKHMAPDVEKYLGKANMAVKEIVSNKGNLALADDSGSLVKGELPKNLNQFSDSIYQTKKNIFNQYDEMAKKTGDKVKTVDLSDAIDEMISIAKNKEVNTISPKVANYAAKMSEKLSSQQFTPSEIQNMISMLNKKLDSFYKNPSYEMQDIAGADSLLSNNFRKALDKTIESIEGKGYQELKNKYGALKSIENDVVHRAIVDARKNVKGLIDFSDMFSAADFVVGITTMSPSHLIKGGVIKGVKEYIKKTNDPNNIIKNMFQKVDSLMGKESMLPNSRAFAQSSNWTNPGASEPWPGGPGSRIYNVGGPVQQRPSDMVMTANGRFQQAVGGEPFRGEMKPSMAETVGSKEPANFFKGTMPTTTYAHPNVGDDTKTYWVNEAARLRAAEEARQRFGK